MKSATVSGYGDAVMGALRSGDWLTRERTRRIAIVCLLLSIGSILFLLVTAHGTLDWRGRPIGTDFSEVYAAGQMVWAGEAAQVWDWPTHFRAQVALHHSSSIDLYAWHYPPPFLLIAAILATMPYLAALFAWQASTLAPFTILIRRITGRADSWLLVLAAPVSLLCFTHGQNGFLTGLLLGCGLLLLDRRPLLAGLVLGCLVYKPQFVLVLPVVLLVTGNWRAIVGAAISALLLVGITLLIWGWPVWQAFLDSLPITRHVIIEQGRTGWSKIMSPFSAVRSWGASVPFAYAVQITATMASAGASAWLARTARPAHRNAAISAAVLVATPYVLDYDFVLLGLAIAWLWRDGEEHGFGPWERTLLALVWAVPLVARSLASVTLVPLGLLSAIAILAMALVRASPSRHSRAVSAP